MSKRLNHRPRQRIGFVGRAGVQRRKAVAAKLHVRSERVKYFAKLHGITYVQAQRRGDFKHWLQKLAEAKTKEERERALTALGMRDPEWKFPPGQSPPHLVAKWRGRIVPREHLRAA